MNDTPFLVVTIPEQPIAMQRPRLGKGHTYNPQAADKERLGWLFKEAMMRSHKNCTAKPLSVQITFHFIRVKSNKRKYHTSTPDIDNCIKFYLDAMQDVVYLNDSQVIELSAKKLYSVPHSCVQPMVEIVVFEV
jgi:Holliday junction resolvase RusA-like endonuclease